MPSHSPRRILAAVVVTAALAGAVRAEPGMLTARALKAAYLECEREALTRPMAAGRIAECSELYEALKARVFDGDWQRLRRWTEAVLASGQEA